MIEHKISKLNSYFDKEISLCKHRSETLLADDRADEADHEKIKANVYDIFCTILSVAVKTGKGDSEAVRHFFLLKIQQIPSNWAASYEQAKLHDDMVKMQIEQIKLDTINNIKEMFTVIWDASPTQNDSEWRKE